jgi:hypothetical protein
MYFANAVLHIGEEEFGLRSDDQKKELLTNSLPELSRLTLLDLQGVDYATRELLLDAACARQKRQFLTADSQRLHVGYNMGAIQDRIQEALPDVASNNHRGCPVIYHRTHFNGREVPIFSAMNATLIRAYCATGALAIPTLRMV